MKRDVKNWSITKELTLDRRKEDSNSCDRTLIFNSSSFIAFICWFFSFFLINFLPFLVFQICITFSAFFV
jgi:hypothetical protein